MTKFRPVAALGALAMAAGLLVAGTAPAQATDTRPYPECGGGNFCVWDDVDDGGQLRDSYAGNAQWNSWLRNDDYAWNNNGSYDPGWDHVRIYDTAPAGADKVTLCIHQGHRARWYANDRTRAAAGKGNYHVWGDECRSGEPQT